MVFTRAKFIGFQLDERIHFRAFDGKVGEDKGVVACEYGFFRLSMSTKTPVDPGAMLRRNRVMRQYASTNLKVPNLFTVDRDI